MRIRSAFGFPIARLQRYCDRFDLAMRDEEVGARVRAHLPPDHPEKFTALRARLDELAVLQAAAHGQAGELTQAMHGTLADVVLLCGSARQAARAAHARDAAVLHGEFFVGGHHSKSYATIIANAGKMVANCTARAEALAPHGWSAAETEQLATAVDALKAADTRREEMTDLKEGYTAEQTATANELYRMCRAIQNVARVVYARSKIAVDPALVEGRAKFMLGEFPPRPGTATEPEPPAEPPTPTPAPTPPANSTPAATTPSSTPAATPPPASPQPPAAPVILEPTPPQENTAPTPFPSFP